MTRKHTATHDTIEVVGATANNLQCIDLSLPGRGVTAIVGVSGSGKTSLLAETLGAEARRRTERMLGFSARGLPRRVPWAFVGPLPPVVYVGQRAFRGSVRTTVGTATGLLTTLRRLFV